MASSSWTMTSTHAALFSQSRNTRWRLGFTDGSCTSPKEMEMPSGTTLEETATVDQTTNELARRARQLSERARVGLFWARPRHR